MSDYKPKRFVIEAFNHFIKEYENNDLMKETVKTEKITKLNKLRNAYICGLMSEREALQTIVNI